MELSEMTKPRFEICHNCHKEIIVYSNDKGDFKYRCVNCGAVSVSHRKNRRVVVIEITAPHGQELI